MSRAELERRPLLVLCLGLLLGLTLVRHPLHLLLLLPAPWVLRGLGPRTWIVLGLVVGVLLGPGQPAPMLEERAPVRGDWTVATMPSIQPFGESCEIERAGVRLELTYQGSKSLAKGSTVRLRTIAKPVKEGSQAFFELHGLAGRVDATDSDLQVSAEAPWIDGIAGAWRDRFLSIAGRNLSPADAAALDSMCFRVTGSMDDTTKEQVLNSGAIHLLQSSGLQAILIGQALLWLCGWLPIPRWAQIALVGGVLALYVIATGSSPSIMRAVVMWLVAQSAYLFRREPDWPSALALSSILYLMWFPGGVYEAGFQLTFLAVFMLSAFSVPSKWKPGVEAWAYRTSIQTIRSTVVAYTAIAPLIAYYFGTVSLVTVPVSLLIVVAAVPAVMLAMTASALSWLVPAVAGLLLKATAPLLGFVFAILNAYGGADAVAQSPSFSAYWLVPYYGLMLALWRPHVRQP